MIRGVYGKILQFVSTVNKHTSQQPIGIIVHSSLTGRFLQRNVPQEVENIWESSGAPPQEWEGLNKIPEKFIFPIKKSMFRSQY